nr:protein stoned B [Hymenolepis microstoma]
MSRERVNPISNFVRRLSKTLSLKRTSISSADAEELAEYVHHPHVPLHTTKREHSSRSFERTRNSQVPVRASSACPAPLASADCFDITDVSDMETGTKDTCTDENQEVESENGSIDHFSYMDSEETQVKEKYYENEDPGFTLSGIPSDQIYDFSYPEVEREETEAGSISTVRRTESSIDVDESDITYSEEEFEDQKEHQPQQPNAEECVPEIREDVSEGDSNENTGQEEYREVHQDGYDHYNYPQSLSQPDPHQDPFSEAMFRAEQHHLTTSPPAILVTSPSNQDITQRSPSRPPLPINKPTPPPVPPLPKEIPENSRTEPTRPPPPRPTVKPTESITPEASPNTLRKKHKIFGINVGPLPSDPDPNFPFQSHFEKKHVLPNPKKGLQNIIGGEKRKQRLKRKEKAELERIIKSTPIAQPIKTQEDHTVSPAKSYLSDWREFQARIQATVTDTTSRLESLKWAAEPTQEKKNTSSSWANFEAHQEPQVVENWAEFAEEKSEGQNHTEESSYQEDHSEYPIKEASSEHSTEPVVQEDDWADFDNLRSGEQATELTSLSLNQTAVNEWSSRPQPEREEKTDNWAELEASRLPESGQSASGIPSDNNWANFALDQKEERSDYLDDQPKPQDHLDLSWLESELEENQRPIAETSTETTLSNAEQGFDPPVGPSKTIEKIPIDLNWLESEPRGNQRDYPIVSSEQFTQDSSQDQIQSLGAQISNQQENADIPANFESELISRNIQGKSRETSISQSSSFDRLSSTPSQIQHYGYDDPSSQVTTEIYQSSVDEPTVMEESSPATSVIDHERSKDYHCDYSTNSNDNVQRDSQPTEYDTSYGYDDSDGESHLAQEISSVASSEVSEFVSDVIDTAEAKMETQAISPEIVELYTNNARIKSKAVRQGTITENNPFRRVSRTENPENAGQELNDEQIALEDEKTTLATVTLFSQSVHDEDEEVEEEASLEYENAELATTPKDKDFDPFQTIYPTSDKESSSENEDESDKTIPQISIKMEKVNNEKSKLETSNIPVLPAPPKTETPAYSGDINLADDEAEFRNTFTKTTLRSGDLECDSQVPKGWETFTSDKTAEPEESADATGDELMKAFEVDWSKPPVPVATIPEAPRSETPDLELEIPFNPPPPENPVWRMWIRYPEKKKKVKQVSKYTTDRTWKEIAITLSDDRGRCEINLHDIDPESKEYVKQPYRTLRVEPYMQLSRCKLQQYDKYGKLNIFKVNHVAYKELPGMRPEKFSIKTFQNLISHKPKQNVVLDHLPVYTEILKFGSMDRPLMRSLMTVLEDSLMKIPAHKDEGINYTHEEVCCYVVDEYVGKLSVAGIIEEQKARTRIFCSAFVNGSPHIVLGINDKWRFGREVVRRSDILPVLHDDWITIWKPEFHSLLEMNDYDNDHLLKFYPLDGCKFELMRFRVSLRHNRELPMQIHCTYSIDDRKISMRCELMVPGYFTATGRSGATPCEDVEIRIPVPEEWIYHFRVEKHHKMGSVHSTLRKPGRIKGLERITQMAQSLLPPSLLEASIGLAKYEHIFKAIVWRIPRIPDKNEASYRPHLLTCNLLLNPHDTVPEWDTLEKDVHIEFTMPSSTVSGTTVRSISVETTGNAEKFVKYTAKYRLTKSIDYQLGHRKDKPLVGILDVEGEAQNSSSDSEPEPEEDENVGLPVNANDSKDAGSKVTVEGGVAVDDLIGEGLRSTTPTHRAQPDTSQSNELVDIFG